MSLEISSRSSGKLYYSRRGSITSRNGKRLKSVSRVQIRPIPCSRMRMGMRVVEQIAGKMRQLQNNLLGDVGVPLCRGKNCEAWRGEQRGNEVPRRRCAPWPSHDARWL